jgi:hypothetical protein
MESTRAIHSPLPESHRRGGTTPWVRFRLPTPAAAPGGGSDFDCRVGQIQIAASTKEWGLHLHLGGSPELLVLTRRIVVASAKGCGVQSLDAFKVPLDARPPSIAIPMVVQVQLGGPPPSDPPAEPGQGGNAASAAS